MKTFGVHFQNFYQEELIKIKFILMALCAAIVFGANPAHASSSGIVKTVRGQVRIERGTGDVVAKVGDPVQEQDRVVVPPGGSIGISMSDETLLSIGSNSTVVISKYNFNPVTREGQVETSILKGSFRFVSGLIARLNPGAIKISTPSATIGIRGTDFIVEVTDGK
jgi:hypothetical protein